MKKGRVAMAIAVMAMAAMAAMMAGCGSGADTAANPAAAATDVWAEDPAVGLSAAARPTATPGQMEIVAFVTTVPTLRADFLWFTLERTDAPEPVLARLSGIVAAVNPITGEAKVLIDGLDAGGDYAVKISSAIPGTNPPVITLYHSNQGPILEQTLTFNAAHTATLW